MEEGNSCNSEVIRCAHCSKIEISRNSLRFAGSRRGTRLNSRRDEQNDGNYSDRLGDSIHGLSSSVEGRCCEAAFHGSFYFSQRLRQTRLKGGKAAEVNPIG